MIDARELRIGNWVLHNGSPRQVKCIYPEDNNMPLLVEDCDPIILTPEVLEKAGFYNAPHDPEVWAIKGPNGMLSMVLSDYRDLSPKGFIMNMGESRVFKYLHEVQNYIHALTGRELDYKP